MNISTWSFYDMQNTLKEKKPTIKSSNLLSYTMIYLSRYETFFVYVCYIINADRGTMQTLARFSQRALQKTTYYRSSGLITTLLTTIKVVHNETNNSTRTKCPKNLSDPNHPIHHNKTTILETTIAALSGIFLLLLLVHFLVYLLQKFYKKKNVFQDLVAWTNCFCLQNVLCSYLYKS